VLFRFLSSTNRSFPFLSFSTVSFIIPKSSEDGSQTTPQRGSSLFSLGQKHKTPDRTEGGALWPRFICTIRLPIRRRLDNMIPFLSRQKGIFDCEVSDQLPSAQSPRSPGTTSSRDLAHKRPFSALYRTCEIHLRFCPSPFSANSTWQWISFVSSIQQEYINHFGILVGIQSIFVLYSLNVGSPRIVLWLPDCIKDQLLELIFYWTTFRADKLKGRVRNE